MAVGHAIDDPFARRRSPVSPLHLRIGPEFIEKDQVDDPPVCKPVEPDGSLGDDVGAVPLGGMRRLFFRGSFSRARVRQTVPRQAGLPIAAATSAKVASGCRLISLRIAASSLSLYARWSSVRAVDFGARLPVSRSRWISRRTHDSLQLCVWATSADDPDS
jgi:hypothetical protein